VQAGPAAQAHSKSVSPPESNLLASDTAWCVTGADSSNVAPSGNAASAEQSAILR
jgi:hypothetical protein